MVYAISGCVLLYYLLNVPVCASFELFIGENSRMVFRIGVFHGAWFYEKEIPLGMESVIAYVQNVARPVEGGIRFAEAVRYALSRVDVRRIWLYAEAGTGDAAKTAILCGAVSAAAEALRAAHMPGELRIKPQFAKAGLYIDARCIVALKVGHIMRAVTRLKRRKSAWKNIPLKPS